MQTWRGASGQAFRFTAFALTDCPPVGPATYVAARRATDGTLVPLHVGVVATRSGTWNLARMRQRAAEAGANEIHIRINDAEATSRTRVARDLRARLAE